MRKSAVLFVLTVAAFLAGLSAIAWMLGRASPQFDEFVIRQKLTHFAQHRDEYDTLFLGSSRVYHQISPAIFDQLTREAGRPTRSFNLGVDALVPPEDSYIAEHILSLRPKNLRWVFVEVSMFLPDWSEKNPGTARAVYWHDWTRTRMVLNDILQTAEDNEWTKRKESGEKRRSSLQRCWLHLQMFGRNVTNLGKGGGILEKLLKRHPRVAGAELGPRQDGYAPLGADKGGEAVSFKGFEKQFAARLRKEVRYNPMSPVAQENFERLLNTIRKTGATPVLVLSPALSANFSVPREPARELYLDFADVHTWPELYRKEHFVDAGHLSEPGAELYTRLLTERWLAATGLKVRDRVPVVTPATSTLDASVITP